MPLRRPITAQRSVSLIQASAPVAISAFEIIATHPMRVLEMADHGFDGGATAHLDDGWLW
jgi:hypothetical protein